jgi:hypothetical protein
LGNLGSDFTSITILLLLSLSLSILSVSSSKLALPSLLFVSLYPELNVQKHGNGIKLCQKAFRVIDLNSPE